jgi:DNA-binding IclR family transcriptional regulator
MDSLSGVGVLDKALAVLRALERGGPSTLAELQASAGLPRATAHRLAVALEHHGLVRRDGEGRFALGLGLIGLGHAASGQFALDEVARPILEQLRDDTGESVQLYVREGDGRRCVVSLQSPHGLRWIVPEGVLLPLDRGSAGKVLRRPVPDEVTAHGGRRPPTAVSSPWVESVEEREKGVASVSAPVRDATGVVVAAVSVSGPVERMTRAPGRRFGAAVAAAAARLGAALH